MEPDKTLPQISDQEAWLRYAWLRAYAATLASQAKHSDLADPTYYADKCVDEFRKRFL